MSKTSSGSFPPNVQADVKSYSHIWVREHLEELRSPLVLTYRTPTFEEISEITALHEEWFPINYPQSYFDSINGALTCLVAVISPSDYQRPEDKDVIAGVILYRIGANPSNANLNWRYFMRTTYSAYITTIGVIEELRGFGIAKNLIKKCVEACEEGFGNILYLGLHVATYNYEGIPFYEKLGFTQVETLYGHYYINGASYDAYYYILYMNGAITPTITWDNIGSAVKRLISLPLQVKSLIY